MYRVMVNHVAYNRSDSDRNIWPITDNIMNMNGKTWSCQKRLSPWSRMRNVSKYISIVVAYYDLWCLKLIKMSVKELDM
jgi:hypothetical protein